MALSVKLGNAAFPVQEKLGHDMTYIALGSLRLYLVSCVCSFTGNPCIDHK